MCIYTQEIELQPIRNRLLRLTTVTPTTSTANANANANATSVDSSSSMSEKEWHNLCVLDLSKLCALTGY